MGDGDAACAPEALLLTKRMLNETIGEHLSTLLTAGAGISATARTTRNRRRRTRCFSGKASARLP